MINRRNDYFDMNAFLLKRNRKQLCKYCLELREISQIRII